MVDIDLLPGHLDPQNALFIFLLADDPRLLIRKYHHTVSPVEPLFPGISLLSCLPLLDPSRLFLPDPVFRRQPPDLLRKSRGSIGRPGRTFQHRLRHSQLSRNIKGTAFPRLADDQAVGGLKALLIEGHPRVDHALRPLCILLHLRVMGGHQKQGSALFQLFQDRHCDAHPLCRVRTRSQLVQDHQAVPVHLL